MNPFIGSSTQKEAREMRSAVSNRIVRESALFHCYERIFNIRYHLPNAFFCKPYKILAGSRKQHKQVYQNSHASSATRILWLTGLYSSAKN